MVNEENMLELLMADANNDQLFTNMRVDASDDEDDDSDRDSEEEGALLHFAAADEALVKMLKAKQEHRKKGLMAMCKRQILLKSRVLDIFEVCFPSNQSLSFLIITSNPFHLIFNRLLLIVVNQELSYSL